MAGGDPILVEIIWHANPLRGERFAAAWLPHAEATLDFGAIQWGFYRSAEGGADFIQQAIFRSKGDFERYWYSEEIAEARTENQGLFQVPLLPTFHSILGMGTAVTADAQT